jgi:hypothetical protein
MEINNLLPTRGQRAPKSENLNYATGPLGLVPGYDLFSKQ